MKLGIFSIIVIMLINLSVGVWSVIEIMSWFGKSLPLIANIVIGLFVGEFSIPVAIVGHILKICGVF